MIKVIINDQSYPQRSKQPSLLLCMPCPACKYLFLGVTIILRRRRSHKAIKIKPAFAQDHTVPGGLRAVSRFCSPLQSHPSTTSTLENTNPSRVLDLNPELPLLLNIPGPLDQTPSPDQIENNGGSSSVTPNNAVASSTTPRNILKNDGSPRNATTPFMSFPITINSTLVFLDFKTTMGQGTKDSFEGAFSFHSTISKGTPHPNTWCDLTVRGDAFPFLPKLAGR